jgi:hypothetical protein
MAETVSFAKVPGYTFLKANKVFSGSYQGMRFRMAVSDDGITASVWPNPWCFEKTDPQTIRSSDPFAMTVEGIAQAQQWIEAQYQADIPRWEESRQHPLG